MATYSAQHPELLEADVKDIFFKGFTGIPTLYTQIFNVVGAERAYVDGMRVAALGTFVVKGEGAPIGFDDPVSGAVVRTVHTVYALGFRVSEEMMDDDQHGIITQMPADLGDSARDHQERLAWGLINDGFNGTTYTGLAQQGGTTRPLFSTTQTHLKTGTTQSNMLSPPVALSETGIAALMTRASITQSEEDRFILQSQSKLVIHPNLQHQAYVLLQTEFKPGSSDNDRNTVISSRSGLTPLEVPYLSSTTAWFVFANDADLTWNNRRSLRMDRSKDADTFDQKFYGSYRARVMFREWRGSFGSNA